MTNLLTYHRRYSNRHHWVTSGDSHFLRAMIINSGSNNYHNNCSRSSKKSKHQQEKRDAHGNGAHQAKPR